MDDDAYIVLPHVLAFMNSHNVREPAVYGQMCSLWRPSRGPPDHVVFCGGASFLMPRWVAEQVACTMGRLPYPPRYAEGNKVRCDLCHRRWPSCAVLNHALCARVRVCVQVDVVISRIIAEELPHIASVDSKEFCSQPPEFYNHPEDGAGHAGVGTGMRNKPQGWGAVISWHYMLDEVRLALPSLRRRGARTAVCGPCPCVQVLMLMVTNVLASAYPQPLRW